MRNLPTASETTTTRTRGLFALAALLLCAGLAQAQEQYQEESANLRRPMVNVKPFEDMALRGKQLVEQGKLGPDTTLDVSATAERAADGRLKPESVQVSWHQAPADETTAMLAQQALTAFSESRVLGALDGVTTVRLALKLDRQNVSVTMALEMPAELDANRYVEGYRLLVRAGTVAKNGTDEGELYKRLDFSSEGKMFKMSFEMPRAEAARMVADMLERRLGKTVSRQD